MTREFRNHEQEHAAPDTDLALDTAHDRESARRTSLIGLEREANKHDLPPGILGFAKKDETSGGGGPTRSNHAKPVPANATRENGDNGSLHALDQSMTLVATRMHNAGDQIDALTMPDTRSAGGGAVRSIKMDALYKEIDAQLQMLISEAKKSKPTDAKLGMYGLQMIRRAYLFGFKDKTQNAAAAMAKQGYPLQVQLTSVGDHIDVLAQALHIEGTGVRELSTSSEEVLVDLAIKEESHAARMNAVAARNRLADKSSSVDLEIERVLASSEQVASILESHATNAKNNPDPSHRLRSKVVEANSEHISTLIAELVALEKVLAKHPEQNSKLASVKEQHRRIQELTK